MEVDPDHQAFIWFQGPGIQRYDHISGGRRIEVTPRMLKRSENINKESAL